MGTRKSPQERIESYRAEAAKIEERERRRLLRRSPQWKATLRAIGAIGEALDVLDADELAGSPIDGEHRNALTKAAAILTNCRAVCVDEIVP